MEIVKKRFGEDHHHLVDALHGLARARHHLGDVLSAKSLHERALNIREKVFGERHSKSLLSREMLNNVLHGHLHLGGQPAPGQLATQGGVSVGASPKPSPKGWLDKLRALWSS